MNLKDSIQQFSIEKLPYFKQWMFDEPLFISNKQYRQAQKLHQTLHKLIVHFVTHYDSFKELMPISDKANRILNYCKQREYNIGTFRTDFVYDKNNQMKIIEITCRFALNGIFLPSVMNKMSAIYKEDHFSNLNNETPYENVVQHLELIRRGAKKIFVLKGGDQRNSSRSYTEIYERLGVEVISVHFGDIKNHLNEMKDSWIISELALEEIEEIDDDVLKELCNYNVTNDFRTVFLVHDKRFFKVIGNSNFQKSVLSPTEINEFKSFYIPTYSYGDSDSAWKDAQENKNNWILKHRSLGKSQEIHAGIVTEKSDWDALFVSPIIKNMVLQKWIPQKTISGSIGNENYQDFITGTLLFFDDQFFGFGDFRTSSFPVTNKVDHRKVSSIIIAPEEQFNASQIQNYII